MSSFARLPKIEPGAHQNSSRISSRGVTQTSSNPSKAKLPQYIKTNFQAVDIPVIFNGATKADADYSSHYGSLFTREQTSSSPPVHWREFSERSTHMSPNEEYDGEGQNISQRFLFVGSDGAKITDTASVDLQVSIFISYLLLEAVIFQLLILLLGWLCSCWLNGWNNVDLEMKKARIECFCWPRT